MPLTELERVKVRGHLGFVNLTQVSTFAVGTPAGVESAFVIEGAMNNVPEAALPLLRQYLAVLDKIEAQKVDDLENMAVDKLGNIELRADEQEALDRQYERWQGKVADLLGVYVNPFSKAGGRGINVPVMG